MIADLYRVLFIFLTHHGTAISPSRCSMIVYLGPKNNDARASFLINNSIFTECESQMISLLQFFVEIENINLSMVNLLL